MSRYGHIDIAVAKRRSNEQLDQLLNDTKSNKFFTAQEVESVVGYLWLIENEDEVFVAYLYVLSRFRRKGYGEKMIKWAESHAIRRGAKRLSLHVFASNIAAIQLYEECGFIESNIRMLKPLAPHDNPR